jgi:hypothetical protein
MAQQPWRCVSKFWQARPMLCGTYLGVQAQVEMADGAASELESSTGSAGS